MSGIPGAPTPDFHGDFLHPPLGTILNDRYILLRKLGQGAHGSLWLVSKIVDDDNERRDIEYYALKILTVSATEVEAAGITRELQFMRVIAQHDVSGLPVLIDDFETVGPTGQPHLCLVMYVLGPTLSDFRRTSPTKALPVHVVKSVVAQILDIVSQLHAMGIIHTDIKPTNVLLHCPSDKDIERYLVTPPSLGRRLTLASSDEQSNDSGDSDSDDHGMLVPRSQPVPQPFRWDCTPHEAEVINVTLVDFGKAQAVGEQPTVSQFAAGSLRTPEDILRGSFGPKIDIWAVGCLAFELLTGRWLFHPEEGETWTLEDDHLAKMIELTGDKFSPEMLDHAMLRNEYFDENGNLLRIDQLFPRSLEDVLREYSVLEEEVPLAAQFLRDCLRLDPLQRPNIVDLERHSWLKNAFAC